MLFNSLIFIVFALIFFFVTKLLGKRIKGRLIWLIIASFFFYGWWDWRFIFLIIFSGLVDYFAALGIEGIPKKKKLFFLLSVFANVGSLSLFKYSGFIAENIDSLLKLQGTFSMVANTPDFFLVTPIGISFYTFQSMSYTFDVYRGKIKPTKNIIHFYAYLAMFPQLVAGPIVRAKEMLPQMLKVTSISKENRWSGFQLIVRGYFKKMVIADNLAPLVVTAFSSPELNQSSAYWWGIMIAFAFQIYCDFAGYSDIARGLAKWMGYDFPDNFNHPYISTSLREFWTRWHISLSSWFKDYLYIPLGGSKKGKFRTYINLWITMVVSGFWHGAAWTFILWGAVHAMFLSIERITNWPEKMNRFIITRIITWLLVTIQVLVAWVFFRAETIDQAWEIIQILFAFKGPLQLGWGLNGTVFISIMVIREMIVITKTDTYFKWKHVLIEMIFYALVITSIIFLRGEGSEFIYFQF
ncbi:MAG: MBOAT family protein [Bacteroidetes bacterium]|nr:MBOAT family protein [Bacteroidota bacterium]